MPPVRTGAIGRCLWAEESGAADQPGPPLPDRVEVAVVGGGYTGLAAGRALGQAGVRVAVLERHRIGWGASGRNGGFVLPGFQPSLLQLADGAGEARAGALYRQSVAAVHALEALIEAEAIDCGYRRCGALALAARPGHLRALERERRCLQRVAGHETGILAGAELASEIGSRRYHGALLDASAGALHPGRFLRGLAAAAQRAGAALHDGAEVTTIRRLGDGLELLTGRGVLRADSVLVATDGYTGAPFTALARRVIPVGSHVVATAPLVPSLAVELMPGGRVCFDTRRLLHYFRLSPDGRMVFGGRVAMASRGTGQAARALWQDMREVFPALGDTPVDFAWSGQVGFTRDRMPHAGRLDGLYYALGYCGHGVAFATWLGGRMGEALAGRGELPDLGPPPRVPLYRGRPWFLPLVDAYFRVMDRIG